MNKGDIVYFKTDITTNDGKVLKKDCGYEVNHIGANYVSVYCWVNGYCNVHNHFIDYSKLRNDKIDELLDEA